MDVEVGVTDLVYYVLAGSVQRCRQLVLQQVEVSVDGLLQHPALWLDGVVHGVLLYDGNYLLLPQKDCGPHVVVVFLHAGLTAGSFFPDAAVRGAEQCNFLSVLALVH